MASSDLADRGTRLGAVLIDSLASLPGKVLVGLGAGMLGHEGDISSMITDPTNVPLFSPPSAGPPFLGGLGLFLLLVVSVLQLWWITALGQSIGKRILGIKIVRMDTGKNGGFVTNILMRGFVFFLIACLIFAGSIFLVGFLHFKGPLAWLVLAFGPLFLLADPLTIFSADKRCIHDHIAGTQVVKA